MLDPLERCCNFKSLGDGEEDEGENEGGEVHVGEKVSARAECKAGAL